MKKLILTIALLCATAAQAQLKFGVKAGMNLSSNSVDDAIVGTTVLQTESYNGFMVGPTLEIMLPFIGMGVEASALYSQKGIAFENFGKATVSYIDIPLNLKYKIGIPKLAGIYAVAGPYLSYSFPGAISGSAIQSIDTKTFDLGANFGLGVELLSKVQVGANYSFGFGKNKVNIAGQALNYKNGVLALTAAWFF